MKLTLQNVRELKKKSDSPLFKRVCNYVISEWGNYATFGSDGGINIKISPKRRLLIGTKLVRNRAKSKR